DRLDTTFDPNNLTLRDAVALANSIPEPDTITFAPALSGMPIRLSLGQLQITEAGTIQGLGAASTTIDAQQHSPTFDITHTAGSVALDGLTLTGGRTTAGTDGGGAVGFAGAGTLAVAHCTLSGNSAPGVTSGVSAPGGAIASVLGAVTVTDSTLS